MAPVTWIFVGIAAVAVFAIAAGVIGREAHRLDAIAPRAVYQLDDAVLHVADRLPAVSQARLTPSEVESLLVVHLRWMHDAGLQPDRVVDVPQSDAVDVTISDDGLVAALLQTADELGVELLDDVDAVHVVDAHLEYLDVIGAVGAPVPPDDFIDRR